MPSIYSPTVSTLFPTGFCSHFPGESHRLSLPNRYAQSSSSDDNNPFEIARFHKIMGTPPARIAEDAAVQESSTKDATSFGAVQFNSSKGYWKRWYLVENDGNVGYAPEWEHPSGYSGLAAAARQGLAAGKIWIAGSHARTVDGLWFSISGFCLDDQYFITATHYLMDASSEDRTASVAQMTDPSVQGIVISVNQTSKETSKYRDDTSLRNAYLVTEIREHDIAIFRIKEGEKLWEHKITPDQLAPADHHIWNYTFSVGYAGQCDGKKVEKQYDDYVLSMRDMRQRHPDLVWRQKLEAANSEIEKPDFQDIFCAHRRAIAFGYVLDIGQAPDKLAQIQGGWRHHTVPGWFGLSGSMMGVLGTKMQVKIIGMFKGGETDELPNRFVAFTPDTIARIYTVIGCNPPTLAHQ